MRQSAFELLRREFATPIFGIESGSHVVPVESHDVHIPPVLLQGVDEVSGFGGRKDGVLSAVLLRLGSGGLVGALVAC